MNRRQLIIRGGTGGFVGLAGCSDVFSDNDSKSWDEAFTTLLDEGELSVLDNTPILIDSVSTESEVRTALGVLGWTTAGREVTDSQLDNLKQTAMLADTFVEEVQPVLSVTNEILDLVDEMKSTSAAGVSVWDALVTAKPGLEQLVTVVEEVQSRLDALSDRVNTIASSTSETAVQLSALQSIQTSDYRALTDSSSNAIEGVRIVEEDLSEVEERVQKLQTLSTEAVDASEGLPAFNEKVGSAFSDLRGRLADISSIVEAIKEQLKISKQVVEGTRRSSHESADEYFSTISNSVTGLSKEIRLDDIDPAVDAYESGLVPDDDTLAQFEPDEQVPNNDDGDEAQEPTLESVDSIPLPKSHPFALTVDESGLWICYNTSDGDNIFHLDRSGSVQNTFHLEGDVRRKPRLFGIYSLGEEMVGIGVESAGPSDRTEFGFYRFSTMGVLSYRHIIELNSPRGLTYDGEHFYIGSGPDVVALDQNGQISGGIPVTLPDRVDYIASPLSDIAYFNDVFWYTSPGAYINRLTGAGEITYAQQTGTQSNFGLAAYDSHLYMTAESEVIKIEVVRETE